MAADREGRGAAHGRGVDPAGCSRGRRRGPCRGRQDPARARGAGTLDGRGVTACWAYGSAAARPLPLGAFVGLLDVPAGDPAEAIGRVLDQLGQRQPLVLAVDDAHLLDEHSAIVLHRVVVRRLAPVLVTLRTGEPVPDMVTALWKDDLLPRLDLAPLDAAATTGLVARVLGRAGRLRVGVPAVDADAGKPAVPPAPAHRRGVVGAVHPCVRDLAVDERSIDLPGAGEPAGAGDRRPCVGGPGRRRPGGARRADRDLDAVGADLTSRPRGGRATGPGAHRRGPRPIGAPALRRGAPGRHGHPACAPTPRPGGPDPRPSSRPDPSGRADARLRPPGGPRPLPPGGRGSDPDVRPPARRAAGPGRRCHRCARRQAGARCGAVVAQPRGRGGGHPAGRHRNSPRRGPAHHGAPAPHRQPALHDGTSRRGPRGAGRGGSHRGAPVPRRGDVPGGVRRGRRAVSGACQRPAAASERPAGRPGQDPGRVSGVRRGGPDR